MSERGRLPGKLDVEVRCTWSASGANIEGKQGILLWCAYTGQQKEAIQDWGWLAALHPEDRERARRLWLYAAERKHFYETWYRIRNCQGAYHTFVIRCMPLMDKDGTLKEWISEIVMAVAERALYATDGWQARLESHMFIEHAYIGMVYLALDGRFLQVNERFCNIVGYRHEELVGHHFSEFTAPEDVKSGEERMAQQRAESGGPYITEKRYVRKDGATIWVSLTVMLVPLPSHEPFCFFTLVEDITERKKLEEEQTLLLEFERAVGDVERRERQEAAALVDQLRAIFEAMTDGVIFCDAQGRLLVINAAAHKMLELEPESDFVGKTYRQDLPTYMSYNEEGQLLTQNQWPLERILRGEVLSSQQAETMILQMPSGRETLLNVSGAPVYDRRGSQIGAVCVLRDITTSRRKERRVQQALDALLTIVEEIGHIPDQDEKAAANPPQSPTLNTVGYRLVEIIRQVLRCQYVACNAIDPQTEKLHFVGVSGLTDAEAQLYKKEVEQTPVSSYFDEETLAKFRANEAVVRDLALSPFVQPHMDFGIRYRLFAPMLLNDQLIGALAIGSSRTNIIYEREEIALVKALARLIVQVIERVRLLNEWTVTHTNELALQEANRRFDSFLSIASHELRTPLTTIKGNVQLSMRRLETLRRQMEQELTSTGCTELVMHGLERVQQPLLQATHRTSVQERMISDLLDASRIRANRLELVKRPYDLLNIVRTTLDDLQYIAAERVVHVHMPEVEHIPIVADADRIGQVINNYLVNAFRYSPPERPVEVTLELIEGGRLARLSVRDQGAGIAEEDLEHIWERFYRSNNNATELYSNAGGGLGLGLHISRTIIDMHGGQVGVSSVRGRGSTFWFTLPLACDPAQEKSLE